MTSDYTLVEGVPTIANFRKLRTKSGLSEKTEEAAILGLPNTWFGVHVLYGDKTVGMGRIIGDGGCHFQVVDMAVLPKHQGKGLGKEIMRSLTLYFEANAPESAYISLIADGEAHHLYSQFSFRAVAHKSIGMSRWVHTNRLS